MDKNNYDVRLKQICESFLDESMEYNDVPGLAAAVTMDGRRFAGTRGVRDMVTGDPLREGDVFHCASLSKLLTSSAVMKLAEAGLINPEDRLADVLPDLFESDSPIADKRWANVKICHMLSHTAGIGDITSYHWDQALTGGSVLSDYVHSPEVRDMRLLWEPGQGKFQYSNIAYEILGHIVSAKSAGYGDREQLSYEDFISRYLLQAAGMNDSTMLTFARLGVKEGEPCPLITEEIRRKNREIGDMRTGDMKTDDMREGSGLMSRPMVLPHERQKDRSITPVKYYPYTRSHSPSSTLTSTLEDLLCWAEVLIAGFRGEDPENRWFRHKTFELVTREYAEIPNNREKMGLGWFMRRQGGYQLYGHEGSDDGFRASFWICPDLRLGIAVLSNLSGAPVKKLNKKLFEQLTE